MRATVIYGVGDVRMGVTLSEQRSHSSSVRPTWWPDVLERRIGPGRVFDRTIALDTAPDGYRAMNDREAIKVLIDF